MGAENDRIDAVIGLALRQFDGSASTEDRAKLQQAMADPVLAVVIAQTAALQGRLLEIHRVRSSALRVVADRRRRQGRQPSRPIGRSMLLAASLLLGIAVSTWLFLQAPLGPSGSVSVVKEPAEESLALVEVSSGSLTAESPAGTRTMLAGGMLRQGERVRLGQAGACVLRLGDGSRVSLSRDAVLHLTASNRLVLERGLLRADVVPRTHDQRLLIDALQAQVAVLGTVVVVEAVEGGGRVAVEQGVVTVRCRPGAEHLTVASGQAVDLASGVLEAVPMGPRITGLRLLNVDDGQELVRLGDGIVLDRSGLPVNCNVQADTDPQRPASVVMRLLRDGQELQMNIEHRRPFGLVQNAARPGDLTAWEAWQPPLGDLVIEAAACAEPQGRQPGPVTRVRLTVVEGSRR